LLKSPWTQRTKRSWKRRPSESWKLESNVWMSILHKCYHTLEESLQWKYRKDHQHARPGVILRTGEQTFHQSANNDRQCIQTCIHGPGTETENQPPNSLSNRENPTSNSSKKYSYLLCSGARRLGSLDPQSKGRKVSERLLLKFLRLRGKFERSIFFSSFSSSSLSDQND